MIDLSFHLIKLEIITEFVAVLGQFKEILTWPNDNRTINITLALDNLATFPLRREFERNYSR